MKEASSHEDFSTKSFREAHSGIAIHGGSNGIAVAVRRGSPGTYYNLTSPGDVGANSATFDPNDPDDGGLPDPVVWHFVLNQLDGETPEGQLTVTFASSGTKTATGISVGAGRTQHFHVGTAGHDVLLSASVVVDSDDGKLVLSHVSWDALPPEEEEPRSRSGYAVSAHGVRRLRP